MSNRVKKYLKVAGLILIGVMIGSAGSNHPQPKIVEKPVEKVVTKDRVVEKKVEVTPASCERVLVIDNTIFHLMAVNFPSYNFQPITDYLNSVSTERGQVVSDCQSKV